MRWKFFTLDEFRCPCCGVVDIDPQFVDKLDKLRGDMGLPFVVTSGYRCAKRNKDIGGQPNSPHRIGRAADIAFSGQEAYKLLQFKLADYGFFGIGISQKKGLRFIHLDDITSGEMKARPIVWTY